MPTTALKKEAGREADPHPTSPAKTLRKVSERFQGQPPEEGSQAHLDLHQGHLHQGHLQGEHLLHPAQRRGVAETSLTQGREVLNQVTQELCLCLPPPSRRRRRKTIP